MSVNSSPKYKLFFSHCKIQKFFKSLLKSNHTERHCILSLEVLKIINYSHIANISLKPVLTQIQSSMMLKIWKKCFETKYIGTLLTIK